MLRVSQILVAYIAEVPGHTDSKGEAAPFVIRSHETDKILSSHPTREEAKKHLKQMHIFGD